MRCGACYGPTNIPPEIEYLVKPQRNEPDRNVKLAYNACTLFQGNDTTTEFGYTRTSSIKRNSRCRIRR